MKKIIRIIACIAVIAMAFTATISLSACWKPKNKDNRSDDEVLIDAVASFKYGEKSVPEGNNIINIWIDPTSRTYTIPEISVEKGVKYMLFIGDEVDNARRVSAEETVDVKSATFKVFAYLTYKAKKSLVEVIVNAAEEPKPFTAHFIKPNGFRILDKNGKEIEKNVVLPAGSSFTFRLFPNEAMATKKVVVTADGNTIVPNARGYYTFVNIFEDLLITITIE